jgi:hypothetical protein
VRVEFAGAGARTQARSANGYAAATAGTGGDATTATAGHDASRAGPAATPARSRHATPTARASAGTAAAAAQSAGRAQTGRERLLSRIAVWKPTEQPIFDRGEASTFSGDSRVAMQGKPKYAENFEIGVAAGLHNSIRLFYNSMGASGDITPTNALTLWSQPYSAGEYISTNYKLINAKLSYEYLTWPYPVGSKKFRLKTLWQVQYTSISSGFDAPKNYYDTNGNLIVDPSTGEPINLVGQGTRNIITPTFGLGGHYYWSRHLRFEVNGSGFAVPHHWTVWDTDATVNFRFLGHLELRVGAKAFHFKTSPLADFYVRGTMASAIVGLRWYSNSE